MRLSSERLATSHHESGHAVAGLCLGLAVSQIAIVDPDTHGGALGACVVASRELTAEEVAIVLTDDRPPVASVPKKFGEQLVYLLAGLAAERRFLGKDAGDSGWSDRLHARHLAGLHLKCSPATDRRVDQFLRHFETLADMLVKHQWAWIRRVALELDATGKLTAAEIRALKVEP